MEMPFEILPWDSDFFKFKVARIREHINPAKNKSVLKDLFDSDINLAYYSSPDQLPIFDNNFYSILLVDKKVTYSKKVNNQQPGINIESYNKHYPEEKLVKLAISSGIYSRFNMDERIGRQNFEALYTQWISKSVSKEIADDVLVYKENSDLQGFVTIGKKDNKADIGIIAVDPSSRGKGIGKALMLAAENFYYNKSDTIQVVTQGDNLSACKLYESCGYAVDKTEYFYHLWRLKQ